MADKQPSKSKKTNSDPVVDPNQPSLGWNDYAEKLNGRFAMVGLLALLILEFFTRQDFFTWLGLK